MKILPIEFDSRGFHFKQLKREGMLVVLEKSSDKGYKGFEVCRLSSHNGFELGGVFIEPAESMPPAEKWGCDGFSFMWNEKEKAFAKLDWMRNKQFQSAPQVTDNQVNPIIKRKRGRPPGSKKKS